jgi:hypothetical protein
MAWNQAQRTNNYKKPPTISSLKQWKKMIIF